MRVWRRIPFAAKLLIWLLVLGRMTPTAAQTQDGAQGGRRLTVPYTEFTLPNGLHVILHRDTSVPIVSVNVWYHVGSGSERPGRTGFAHLFEHLMFEGSKHVPEGAFDQWLEAAGGNNNGSTSNDRTNYFIDIPANALELALFVESDRMGYLLDSMTPARVDGQRDVVKNERRQSYENQPYGRAFLTLFELLYPKNHPYSWPTIGSMEDLSAATHEDVVEFFKTFYTPNNASLVIAGDIDISATRALVERWFSEIPAGRPVPPIAPPAVMLNEVTRHRMTDRVQLPRLYLAWHTPALYAPGDAAMDVAASLLAGGKNSRLYRRLVYDLQIAQDVAAFQQSQALGSVFLIIATARPGHTLEKIQAVIDEELEKLRTAPAEEREMTRTLNQLEASFFRRMERVGGFGGKADQLNAYHTQTGMPDFFEEDLARYRALSADDVRSAIARYLPRDRRVELSVVPEGQQQ
jgi:zinc protease